MERRTIDSVVTMMKMKPAGASEKRKETGRTNGNPKWRSALLLYPKPMGLLSHRSAPKATILPATNTPRAQPQAIKRSGEETASQMHLLAKNAHDRQQLKTFTRWWNAELPAGVKLPDGEDGLISGVASGELCCLLIERLTGEAFPARARAGALVKESERTGAGFNTDTDGNRIKMIENQHIFLTRVKSLGIGLVNISEEDLVDGRQTLILGLTWKLITHFSEGMLSDANGLELLSWVKRNVAAHNNSVELTGWSDFSNGMALCALLHSYDPTLLDYSCLKPQDALANLELAFGVAADLGAPRLLDAVDLAGEGEDVDARSLQTYVLKLRQALRSHAERARADAATKLLVLEQSSAELVAWASDEGARLQAEGVSAAPPPPSELPEAINAQPSDRVRIPLLSLQVSQAEAAASASTGSAEERKAAIEAAEARHAALEDFRSTSKAEHAAAKASLASAAGALLASVEADKTCRFDHGHELAALSLPPAADADAAAVAGLSLTERLRSACARADGGWAALEAAEASFEEGLFQLLTYKKTDLLLARAEIEMAALLAIATEQVRPLPPAPARLRTSPLEYSFELVSHRFSDQIATDLSPVPRSQSNRRGASPLRCSRPPRTTRSWPSRSRVLCWVRGRRRWVRRPDTRRARRRCRRRSSRWPPAARPRSARPSPRTASTRLERLGLRCLPRRVRCGGRWAARPRPSLSKWRRSRRRGPRYASTSAPACPRTPS